MSGKDRLSTLVTGGAGFIGSHLADALLEAGHRVEVIDDLSTGRRENLPADAPFHRLDIRSREAEEVVAGGGYDVVFHLAAQMDVRRSTDDPAYDADVNILGTLRLLRGAVEGGVERFVFSSSGGAIYGEQDSFPAAEDHPLRPVSPYGVSKLAGERYLYYFHHEHGLDGVCLRYANVYGERQNPFGEAGVVAIFLHRLLRGEAPTINGDGRQTRDYVHVDDVVRANLAAAGLRGFHTFNVGTGIETDVVGIFDGLREALGSDLEALHGPAKPGEQRRSCVDPDRIQRELGVPEPLPLDAGLRRTADWFRERS
jgi:UDP-glucose 4-epimerase